MTDPTTPAPFDLEALALAIAETLSGGRLSGYPGFRDTIAHAIGDVIEIVLDNGIRFEMRVSASMKMKKAGR